MKAINTIFLPFAAIVLLPFSAFAQNIHYAQIDATPLAVNPAFTGAFDGGLRTSGIYRNQWASLTVPYVTFGVSVDAPIFVLKHGDYFAAGVQGIRDVAGDGNLANFSGIVSVAYHKIFKAFTREKKNNSDFSFGIQAGYDQYSGDLSQLYFNNATFAPAIGTLVSPGIAYHLGVGNAISYVPINAGISFAQSLTPRFNYVIGMSGNNLNQPSDPKETTQNERIGLGPCYALTFGADWQVTKQLTLRPVIFYQLTQNENYLIAGNEFHYSLPKKHGARNKSVFLGAYYHTGDAITVTAGAELRAFRIGLGYDYSTSALNTMNSSNGGFEVMLKYILPHKLLSQNNRVVPCNRF